ncbi:MAG: NAD(P)/FAD-dependent oxidoreductase [Bacillota bacterium]|nr:NAD(P)/FAD-dependent oxidoreductase [Bacillota bacterium]MDI7250325.1 NAD(P)/FAD-dependent oxidoreductase [Bacillota bacterium]
MHDAVLIGSGHNNLVAGVLLARAGWKVVVFEQADEVGGAVRTAELGPPGFRYDAFSSNHTLIFLSPFYHQTRDDLEQHGLYYLPYPIPIASVFPDGKSVRLYPDLERTLDSLGEQSANDARGWKKLYEMYQAGRELFTTLFSSAMPSFAAMQALIGRRLRLGPRGNMEFMQMLTLPARAFADEYFETDYAKSWFVQWALHLPHSPESAGGGAFAWVVMAATQDPQVGLRVPRGGSGGLTQALASLLRSLGGEIHTGSRVTRVIVRRKTAWGVVLDDGTEVPSARAVIACTSPTKLFLDLVGADNLPAEFVGRLQRYRYGLPVLKIDYALSGPPTWKAGEEIARAGIVHLSSGVDAMSLAYNQALRGYLPREPLIILSQPTVADPARAPEGKHILWVIVRVPHVVKGDAAHRIKPRPWRHLKERFADRVTDIIESFTPGLKQLILARHVFSPEDLERANPNLIRGDIGCGSVEFDQSYVFRPLPGWSRYATPIRRLYLTGAATHPGPGIHGMSGYALARTLL